MRRAGWSGAKSLCDRLAAVVAPFEIPPPPRYYKTQSRRDALFGDNGSGGRGKQCSKNMDMFGQPGRDLQGDAYGCGMVFVDIKFTIPSQY